MDTSSKNFFKNNILYFFSKVFVFAGIFLILFIFIFYSLKSLLYPLPLDYGEGVVLNFSKMLVERGSYFFDIHKAPYIHGAYPPVFPAISSFFIKFFGINFFAGRMISFFSSILIVVFLCKLFYLELKDKFYSMVFSVIFLAPSFVIYWSSLYRVDLLAILFGIIGLYIYVKYPQKKLRYFSLVFFVLAFYTKQNAIAAPLAVILYNFFRNKKEFVRVVSLYIIFLVSIFVLLNMKTGGQFYLHMVTYTKFIPWDFHSLPIVYQEFLLMASIFFVMSFVAIKFYKLQNIFILYFIINFIFLVTKTKMGSSNNYFIEPFLSLLIISSLSFFRTFRAPRRHVYEIYLLLLLGLQIFLLIPFDFFYNISLNPFLPSDDAERGVINYYVKNVQGAILSEDLGYLLINNKPITYEPFQFFMMSREGIWDERAITEDCQKKKFSLIIASWRIMNLRGMSECLEKKYFLIESFNNFEKSYLNFYIPIADNREKIFYL